MAHPYHHAKSSARHYGGIPEDYLLYHQWMDHTKAHIADARHRLVLHNTWGIFLAEQCFGVTITRSSDGKQIPLRPILEKHVLEDLGRIPTLAECLNQVTLAPWMYKKSEQLSQKEEIPDAHPSTASTARP